MQKALQAQTRIVPLQTDIQTIGGADISFNKFSDIVYAGIVVLKYPSMEVLETATLITKATFPYIPGLLAFREVPALLEVWDKLVTKPDVLVLDGHGIAHPRRVGVATHFGILASTPAIGCAKSLLVGAYELPANLKYATSPLVHKKEIIGTVLRTKINCKPVFVSPGHLITMDESVTIIKNSTGKHRVPEPTRQAHILVNNTRVRHT